MSCAASLDRRVTASVCRGGCSSENVLCDSHTTDNTGWGRKNSLDGFGGSFVDGNMGTTLPLLTASDMDYLVHNPDLEHVAAQHTYGAQGQPRPERTISAAALSNEDNEYVSPVLVGGTHTGNQVNEAELNAMLNEILCDTPPPTTFDDDHTDQRPTEDKVTVTQGQKREREDGNDDDDLSLCMNFEKTPCYTGNQVNEAELDAMWKEILCDTRPLATFDDDHTDQRPTEDKVTVTQGQKREREDGNDDDEANTQSRSSFYQFGDKIPQRKNMIRRETFERTKKDKISGGSWYQKQKQMMNPRGPVTTPVVPMTTSIFGPINTDEEDEAFIKMIDDTFPCGQNDELLEISAGQIHSIGEDAKEQSPKSQRVSITSDGKPKPGFYQLGDFNGVSGHVRHLSWRSLRNTSKKATKQSRTRHRRVSFSSIGGIYPTPPYTGRK